MVRRDVFEMIGDWTEEYFMYGEDLDLSYKVRQAGFRVYYLPGTKLIHYGGISTEKAANAFSIIMMRESVFKFLRLRRGWVSAWSYRCAMGFASIIRLFLLACLVVTGKWRVRRAEGAVRKWFSILRWSLGLEASKKS
jgi:GT2 family glycosyltransferase